MKPQRKPTSVAVFTIAHQFFDASKWIVAGKRNGFQRDMGMAGITCAAFSLELFFKCLLRREGKPLPRAHDLKVLFYLLEPSTQAQIRNRSKPFIPAIRKRIAREAKRRGVACPKVNFDYALEMSRRAFEHTRYIYEGLPGGSGWIAAGILSATRKLVLEIEPTWRYARVVSPKVSIGKHDRLST